MINLKTNVNICPGWVTQLVGPSFPRFSHIDVSLALLLALESMGMSSGEGKKYLKVPSCGFFSGSFSESFGCRPVIFPLSLPNSEDSRVQWKIRHLALNDCDLIQGSTTF